MNRTVHRFAIFLWALGWGGYSTHAHRTGDAFLRLSVSNRTVSLQLDLPLRDLDVVLGLDTSDNGNLTWGELRKREPDLNDYVARRLSLTNELEKVELIPEPLRLVNHEDMVCASILLLGEASKSLTNLTLTYRCLFETDSQHRALIRTEWSNATVKVGQKELLAADFTGVMSSESPSLTFACRETSGNAPESQTPAVRSLEGLKIYIQEGMHHIWSGYDHLLFLAALLLPSVLRRTSQGWTPVESFRAAFWGVVQVVSAFTIAHSMTLVLAATGWTRPPSRFIESAIAVSVLYAALSNMRSRSSAGDSDARDMSWLRRVWVPFGFGLVHGFGFANALGELGVGGWALLVPLLGFNLGVEFGQLVGVAAFLPAAYLLRRTRFYRRVLLQGGSILIALLAAGWMVDRVFNLGKMPF